ncbi:MAG TPA: hypothetical protein VK889_03730 [Solirubrobacterales bacterium]|nr:hypothetical protein [Solirubrobacterales bacterium]
MRRKVGLVVAALSLLVVTAAPAQAGAVTFVDAGGAIENEAEVFLQGSNVSLKAGNLRCEEFSIATTVAENSANPAVLQEGPATLAECYVTQNPLNRIYPNNVQIGQITMGSDGTGAMPIEFGYTSNVFGWGCSKMQGTLGVAMSPISSEAIQYSGNLTHSGCTLGDMNMAGQLQLTSNNGPAEVTFP